MWYRGAEQSVAESHRHVCWQRIDNQEILYILHLPRTTEDSHYCHSNWPAAISNHWFCSHNQVHLQQLPVTKGLFLSSSWWRPARRMHCRFPSHCQVLQSRGMHVTEESPSTMSCHTSTELDWKDCHQTAELCILRLNVLYFYAKHGKTAWRGTADLISLVIKLRNILKINTCSKGKHKWNNTMDPIRVSWDWQLDFFKDFAPLWNDGICPNNLAWLWNVIGKVLLFSNCINEKLTVRNKVCA